MLGPSARRLPVGDTRAVLLPLLAAGDGHQRRGYVDPRLMGRRRRTPRRRRLRRWHLCRAATAEGQARGATQADGRRRINRPGRAALSPRRLCSRTPAREACPTSPPVAFRVRARHLGRLCGLWPGPTPFRDGSAAGTQQRVLDARGCDGKSQRLQSRLACSFALRFAALAVARSRAARVVGIARARRPKSPGATVRVVTLSKFTPRPRASPVEGLRPRPTAQPRRRAAPADA